MQLIEYGRIIKPEKLGDWAYSHAAYPTPFLKDDGTLRIFFSSRNENKKGRIGWCDVNDDWKVINLSTSPVFKLGKKDEFDEHGVGLGNIVINNNEIWMYYLGLSLSDSPISRNCIGVATSLHNNSDVFEKKQRNPVINLSVLDPYTLSYPFVYYKDNLWHMLYGSNRGGLNSVKEMKHVLTYASSIDGINWKCSGKDVVSLQQEEYALSRPWIINTEPELLLFTIYGESTKIGLAQKEIDGTWRRLNNDLVLRTNAEWANKEVCYASHIKYKDKDYIFYCGNNYGQTGFGVSELIL